MSIPLRDLAERIGATLRPASPGDADRAPARCARLEDAGPDDLGFLANPKYAPQLQTTRAGAVIVHPDAVEQAPEGMCLLLADDPYFAWRNAVTAIHGHRVHPEPVDGPISPKAAIHPTATIGEGTRVHPFAVVDEHATVGRNCVLYPGVHIGAGARVGDDCALFANVVVYEHCVLGDRVTLHAGCVIGQDGFGYATHAGAHHKIPHVGNVVVEDDVDMGANCAVDRAALGSTVIGAGTKFSDLVAIGHGSRIGRHNLFVALVGVAGSVDTGDYVAMGGQVGVAGHLKIGDMVQVAATSGVMNDIPDRAQVGGTPAVPLTEAKRTYLATQRLPDLIARVKKLERQLQQRDKP